jgi:hypothetical protein
MSQLSPYLLVAETTVDPSIEAAFNAWYDNVHLPELSALPGFLDCRRYATDSVRIVDKGAPGEESGRRYLAVYELESLDALTSEAFADRAAMPDDIANGVVLRAHVYGPTA